MEIELSRSQAVIFRRALSALRSISRDIRVYVHRNSLHIEALNDSRTAWIQIAFPRCFFSSFHINGEPVTAGSSNSENGAGSSNNTSCHTDSLDSTHDASDGTDCLSGGKSGLRSSSGNCDSNCNQNSSSSSSGNCSSRARSSSSSAGERECRATEWSDYPRRHFEATISGKQLWRALSKAVGPHGPCAAGNRRLRLSRLRIVGLTAQQQQQMKQPLPHERGYAREGEGMLLSLTFFFEALPVTQTVVLAALSGSAYEVPGFIRWRRRHVVELAPRQLLKLLDEYLHSRESIALVHTATGDALKLQSGWCDSTAAAAQDQRGRRRRAAAAIASAAAAADGGFPLLQETYGEISLQRAHLDGLFIDRRLPPFSHVTLSSKELRATAALCDQLNAPLCLTYRFPGRPLVCCFGGAAAALRAALPGATPVDGEELHANTEFCLSAAAGVAAAGEPSCATSAATDVFVPHLLLADAVLGLQRQHEQEQERRTAAAAVGTAGGGAGAEGFPTAETAGAPFKRGIEDAAAGAMKWPASAAAATVAEIRGNGSRSRSDKYHRTMQKEDPSALLHAWAGFVWISTSALEGEGDGGGSDTLSVDGDDLSDYMELLRRLEGSGSGSAAAQEEPAAKGKTALAETTTAEETAAETAADAEASSLFRKDTENAAVSAAGSAAAASSLRWIPLLQPEQSRRGQQQPQATREQAQEPQQQEKEEEGKHGQQQQQQEMDSEREWQHVHLEEGNGEFYEANEWCRTWTGARPEEQNLLQKENVPLRCLTASSLSSANGETCKTAAAAATLTHEQRQQQGPPEKEKGSTTGSRGDTTAKEGRKGEEGKENGGSTDTSQGASPAEAGAATAAAAAAGKEAAKKHTRAEREEAEPLSVSAADRPKCPTIVHEAAADAAEDVAAKAAAEAAARSKRWLEESGCIAAAVQLYEVSRMLLRKGSTGRGREPQQKKQASSSGREERTGRSGAQRGGGRGAGMKDRGRVEKGGRQGTCETTNSSGSDTSESWTSRSSTSSSTSDSSVPASEVDVPVEWLESDYDWEQSLWI